MPFEIRGMEATIAQFKQLAAGSEEAAKRAVKAGAKVLAQRLQEKAPVDMGELRDSIKPGPPARALSWRCTTAQSRPARPRRPRLQSAAGRPRKRRSGFRGCPINRKSVCADAFLFTPTQAHREARTCPTKESEPK